ncbi:MAG TPA: hypothetical protein VI816_02620 [Candidatus Bathyarchaeia archaeon]|nr:hypothetical protein [Candidatus Bathyarchaeia archaeon]
MGLVPEFFTLLGIEIFQAISLLKIFLKEDLPPRLQYLFQVAAIAGLGQLLMGQVMINGEVLGRDPTDPTRFWVGVLYLAMAVTSIIGLNVYFAVVRRKITLASIFSGTVTVPTVITSALVVASFPNGEVSLTPASILMLTVAALVICLSIFGFLREASKHVSDAPVGQGSSPSGPVSLPMGASGMGLPLHPPPTEGGEWEELPAKDEDVE